MIATFVSKCKDGQRKNFLSEGWGVGLQKPTNDPEVWMFPFCADVVIWTIKSLGPFLGGDPHFRCYPEFSCTWQIILCHCYCECLMNGALLLSFIFVFLFLIYGNGLMNFSTGKAIFSCLW